MRCALGNFDTGGGAQVFSCITTAASRPAREVAGRRCRKHPRPFVKRRDRGGEAEPEDSGGRFAFLSPGLSYKVGEKFRVYSYYQHPLHQDVNRVQLTARRAVVVGLSTQF